MRDYTNDAPTRSGSPTVTGRYDGGSVNGYRIEAIPVDREGRLLQQWRCWRCGIDVDGQGTHLVYRAPCRDCRQWLREVEGDQTIWDKRRLARQEAAA